MNDGGPAFPCNSPDGVESYKGMSLRDWYAGQALTGLIAENAHPQSPGSYSLVTEIVTKAWEYADAMLAKRKEKS